ncbi:MAG: pantoate--beta-alanine ligase [Arsenophonus endosymbiont of Dermacentor nuttalli]
MVSDLAFDITIISVSTVRDQNGLALSTRNTLLTREQPQIAPKLYQVMINISKQLVSGERNIKAILNIGKQQLHEAGFTSQSLFICYANTLQPLTNHSKKAVILILLLLGQTCLIDNLQVTLSAN